MIIASTNIVAFPGLGYDGVVRVTAGGYYGTGVLLHGGRTILTSAHLLNGMSWPVVVHFETIAGEETIEAVSALIHPLYDPTETNHDLALVRLEMPAPISAQRYALYRGSEEIGDLMTMIGYGATGTGNTGTSSVQTQPVRTLRGTRENGRGVQSKTATQNNGKRPPRTL